MEETGHLHITAIFVIVYYGKLRLVKNMKKFIYNGEKDWVLFQFISIFKDKKHGFFVRLQ